MSAVLPTPQQNTSDVSQHSQPQRVLACVLCQQRKVKCDRKVPCANCIKSQSQCVPATLAPRRRRRKFPERELLERLRKYEDLLRHNNINFDPLDKDSAMNKESPNVENINDLDDDRAGSVGADWPPPSTTAKAGTAYEDKYTLSNKLPQGGHD